MFNEFINELREKEIDISFANGKLQYSGPEQYIDEEMIIKLKKYKAKLFKYFWPYDCHNMMPINTEGNKIPFILLHAGKAVYPLKEYFGKDQPFYGFFDEGSDGEKIRYKSVESFAADYRGQIQKIIPSGPYLLGGFSFGGILAYEIAVQLQNQGHDVPILVLGDCDIPSYRKLVYRRLGFINILKNIYHHVIAIYYWLYYNTGSIFYELFTLMKIRFPADYRKSYIIWIYINLMKIYKPTARFHGEILLFRSESNNSSQKLLGWDNLCDNVRLVSINGFHQSMYEDEATIKILREKTGEMLRKANEIYRNE